MEENKTLEQTLLAELQKDVRLKGGSIALNDDGRPMKVNDAIAKSIINNAMKGDIAAVNFVRNFMKQSNPKDDEKRIAEHQQRLQDAIQNMQKQLEDEDLWLGQTLEITQLAQNWLIIENLNDQMQAADYQDVIQEFKKDGSVNIRINPLHEWRDKYQKKFLDDWRALRLDAQQRKVLKKYNKR